MICPCVLGYYSLEKAFAREFLVSERDTHVRQRNLQRTVDERTVRETKALEMEVPEGIRVPLLLRHLNRTSSGKNTRTEDGESPVTLGDILNTVELDERKPLPDMGTPECRNSLKET